MRNITLYPILKIAIFREKNLFKGPCMFHCSWRVVAISLTFLTLVLSSVIVYFGGNKISLPGLLTNINF